eukprot:242565-Pleurochrysis_carterae.AAC.1
MAIGTSMGPGWRTRLGYVNRFLPAGRVANKALIWDCVSSVLDGNLVLQYRSLFRSAFISGVIGSLFFFVICCKILAAEATSN